MILLDVYRSWLSDKIFISFTNVDVIYYCLQNFIWTNNSYLHCLQQIVNCQRNRLIRGPTLGNEGPLVRFLVEAYIFILNFSLAFRCSQLGEANTNKI